MNEYFVSVRTADEVHGNSKTYLLLQ